MEEVRQHVTEGGSLILQCSHEDWVGSFRAVPSVLAAPRFASGSPPPHIPLRVGDYAPHPDTINVLQAAETCSNWTALTHKPTSISTSDGAEAGASRADKSQSAERLFAPGTEGRVTVTLGLCTRSQALTYICLIFITFQEWIRVKSCSAFQFALLCIISGVITTLRRKWLWRCIEFGLYTFLTAPGSEAK